LPDGRTYQSGIGRPTSRGRGSFAQGSAEAETAYEPWAAKLGAALTMVNEIAAAQTVEFNKAVGAHQRITDDLATLKTVLETA